MRTHACAANGRGPGSAKEASLQRFFDFVEKVHELVLGDALPVLTGSRDAGGRRLVFIDARQKLAEVAAKIRPQIPITLILYFLPDAIRNRDRVM